MKYIYLNSQLSISVCINAIINNYLYSLFMIPLNELEFPLAVYLQFLYFNIYSVLKNCSFKYFSNCFYCAFYKQQCFSILINLSFCILFQSVGLLLLGSCLCAPQGDVGTTLAPEGIIIIIIVRQLSVCPTGRCWHHTSP